MRYNTKGNAMSLCEAVIGQEYLVAEINTGDEDLNNFLFSLGCYVGEPITVIRHLKGSCLIAIKNGRYSIDSQLAKAILV